MTKNILKLYMTISKPLSIPPIYTLNFDSYGHNKMENN